MNDTILNTLDFISETGRKALLHIGEELANGNVVLFAGAGLSFNAPSKDGGPNRMPGWNDMAKVLLDRLESDIKDKWDVLKIADYYQTAFGRSVLVEKIVEAVRDDQHVPGRVHQCLAQLNFREIITTNYDTLIERAFRSLYVTPQVVVEGPDLVRRRQPPRIIKMNGCFERNPSKIIVTGDDFLAHSQRDPLIEVFVTKSFVESQVLFIGFSLNDPAFRAINERVLHTLGKDCPVAFSMQFGAGETETKYWSTRQVQVIDLKSGAPSELSGEERIYRVMQALLQIQRAQLAPMPHVTPGVSPGALVKKSDAPCADPAAVLQKALPSATREQIDAFMACDGARGILAHLFGGESMSESSARLALADFLCAATGLAGADGPVVQDNSKWAAVWALVALISEGMRDDPTDGAVDANLTVLCALLMLQFIVAAPERAAALKADERLLEAASRLTFDCLLSHDMAVRSRHLYLLLLLAPLDDLAKLANCWTNGSPERDLYLKNDGANEDRKRLLRVEPTPDEYRLPILSFFNVLQERPVFYQKAAESLWSRELVGGSENGDNRSRYEATLRYRYLLQLANERAHDWPGVHLHQERLVRVLGSRALLAGSSPSPADYAASLQQMLTELARGWLFGSPAKIRGLKRTWQQVRTARTAGEPQRVPYFVQLVATLLVEGADAVNAPQHHELLVDAWHGDLIDVVALMRYIARRVGDAKFTKLAVMTDDPKKKRPLARYEEGLAALAAWIAERIDEEGEASPLRAAAFEHLAGPVENWLPKTHSEAVRAYLVRVLSLMNRWDPDRTGRVFQAWLRQHIADSSRGTLPLAEFDTDGALLADRQLARLLLGRARAQRKGRTDVRNDVETWFVRFADLRSTDERVIGEFAADVVEWLEEEKVTFGWIDRAARVCCSTRLRQAVEQQEVIGAAGGLARYVVGRLQSLPPKAASMWTEKRSAFLGELAVFAPELDLEMRRFLLDMIEQVDLLTEDGREGAAWLAVKMIAANAADSGHWATRLALLIDQGATGRGAFGPYLKYLPTTYPQKVASNLLVMLERRWDTNDPEIIAMIERMIGESPDIFPDLEAALCQLLTSNRRPLAAYAAASLVRLSGTTAIVDRNEQRIRRAQKIIASRSAINGFRASSAFMEALNGLLANRESATLLSQPAAADAPRDNLEAAQG